MALLGLELANIYQNLTNIVLTVTPKAHQTVPAVLVNGHFDSAIGSPGSHTNACNKLAMQRSLPAWCCLEMQCYSTMIAAVLHAVHRLVHVLSNSHYTTS